MRLFVISRLKSWHKSKVVKGMHRNGVLCCNRWERPYVKKAKPNGGSRWSDLINETDHITGRSQRSPVLVWLGTACEVIDSPTSVGF